ncbi:MAG: zf-HC2 domain-containing protein [Candidatus Alcyoniella australis]|nr:zf-HC2 domain-containing protein [Candidatus Alcyoniella australis]
MSKITHEQVLAQLSEYFEGELDNARSAAFDEHLAGCADCRRELELMSRTVKLLGALGEEPVPAALRARVMERIEHDPWWRKVSRALLGEGRYVPARALAYVFLAVFLGVVLVQFPFGSFQDNYIQSGRVMVDANKSQPAPAVPPVDAPIELAELEAAHDELETVALVAEGETSAGMLDDAVDRLAQVEESDATAGLDAVALGGHPSRTEERARSIESSGLGNMVDESRAMQPVEARESSVVTGTAGGALAPAPPAQEHKSVALSPDEPDDKELAATSTIEQPAMPWGALEASPTPVGGVEYTSSRTPRSDSEPVWPSRLFGERLRERMAPKPEAQQPSPPLFGAVPSERGESEEEALDVDKPLAGVELPFIEQYSGVYSGVTTRSQLVLHDAGSFAALWNKIFGITVPLPDVPPVDFEHNFAVAAFLGERASGGFKVRIENVLWSTDRLVVYVNQSLPDPNSAVTLALTQPYHVVILPRQVPGTDVTIGRDVVVEFVLH